MPKPIYTLDERRFEIDNCLPQLSAVKDNKIELNAISHGDYPGKLIHKDVLPGISSMGYLHVVGEQDWGIEAHRNEGIELCFQENGTNILTVDGKKHTTPAKTLTITRPWQLHQVGNPHINAGRLHWIILDVGVRRPNQRWIWPKWCVLTDEDKSDLERLLSGNEHPAWQASSDIFQSFKRLQAYVVAEPIEQYISHITIQLNQLLLGVLELLRTKNIVSEDRLTTKARVVELLLNEIQSSYKIAGYEWTLDLMAKHCGMARSAFSNYCQELTNISPMAYLNHCRVQHAANLLSSNPSKSITDLCYELGFSSSQYFTRCFKKQYGMPPHQWRSQIDNPRLDNENKPQG